MEENVTILNNRGQNCVLVHLFLKRKWLYSYQ